MKREPISKDRKKIFEQFLIRISTFRHTPATDLMIKKYTSIRPDRFNKLLRPTQIIDYILIGREDKPVSANWKMPDYISVIWLCSKLSQINRQVNNQQYELSNQQYDLMDDVMGWKQGESQAMLQLMRSTPYSIKWKKYQFLLLVAIYKDITQGGDVVNWTKIADNLRLVNTFPLAMYRCEHQCQLKWKQSNIEGRHIQSNYKNRVSKPIKSFSHKLQERIKANRKGDEQIGIGWDRISTIQQLPEHILQLQKQSYDQTMQKLEQEVMMLQKMVQQLKQKYKQEYYDKQRNVDSQNSSKDIWQMGEQMEDKELLSSSSQNSTPDCYLFYA